MKEQYYFVNDENGRHQQKPDISELFLNKLNPNYFVPLGFLECEDIYPDLKGLQILCLGWSTNSSICNFDLVKENGKFVLYQANSNYVYQLNASEKWEESVNDFVPYATTKYKFIENARLERIPELEEGASKNEQLKQAQLLQENLILTLNTPDWLSYPQHPYGEDWRFIAQFESPGLFGAIYIYYNLQNGRIRHIRQSKKEEYYLLEDENGAHQQRPQVEGLFTHKLNPNVFQPFALFDGNTFHPSLKGHKIMCLGFATGSIDEYLVVQENEGKWSIIDIDLKTTENGDLNLDPEKWNDRGEDFKYHSNKFTHISSARLEKIEELSFSDSVPETDEEWDIHMKQVDEYNEKSKKLLIIKDEQVIYTLNTPFWEQHPEPPEGGDWFFYYSNSICSASWNDLCFL